MNRINFLYFHVGNLKQENTKTKSFRDDFLFLRVLMEIEKNGENRMFLSHELRNVLLNKLSTLMLSEAVLLNTFSVNNECRHIFFIYFSHSFLN